MWKSAIERAFYQGEEEQERSLIWPHGGSPGYSAAIVECEQPLGLNPQVWVSIAPPENVLWIPPSLPSPCSPGTLTCECTALCCSRLTAWPNVLPHSSQAKGLVPLCERRTCTSSPWGVEKTWEGKEGDRTG